MTYKNLLANQEMTDFEFWECLSHHIPEWSLHGFSNRKTASFYTDVEKTKVLQLTKSERDAILKAIKHV